MPKLTLKPRHFDFIKANRLVMSSGEMAKKIRVNRSTIQRYLKKNGLSIPMEYSKKFRSKAMRSLTTSTPAEDKFIRENYMTMPSKRMADQLNRSDMFIRTRKRQLGLITPRHIIEKFIDDSRVKKGNIPLNKGKKWKDFMSKEGMRNSRKTCFKKGNIPHTTKHDGCIVIKHGHKKRDGRPYKWIRLSKSKWQPLHAYNWKRAGNKIPKGYIVVFKNGDTMNCDISNLELISMKENVKRNSIHRYPAELKQAIRMLKKIERKIKQQNGKKQNS